MAATQNNVVAQNNLAGLYERGQGMVQDVPGAVKLYAQAANAGYAPAQFNLGRLYLQNGPLQNYEQAFHWLSRAADQGDARALTSLGFIYEQGLGTPPSQNTAANLYAKAAAMNDPIAEYRLGAMYFGGRGGLPPDENAAYQLFKKAAEQGDVDAVKALGNAYWTGGAAQTNAAEAVHLLQRAAEQGDPEAQYAVGKAYLDGQIGQPDPVAAAPYL
jgi:TPR repeat protein